MFCSNCGNRLPDGARFCSECGNRVTEPAMKDITEPVIPAAEDAFSAVKANTEEPKKPAAYKSQSRGSMDFDWSNVIDEPHKRRVQDIKSPWGSTGTLDEKDIYSEMTPSTDKSRTMNFIELLKAEKEEKARKAADDAIEYTEVLSVDPDLSQFDNAPKLHPAPLYDLDTPVKTPFDHSNQRKSRGLSSLLKNRDSRSLPKRRNLYLLKNRGQKFRLSLSLRLLLNRKMIFRRLSCRETLSLSSMNI